MVTLRVHQECRSELGIITNSADVKSAPWTLKPFWNSPSRVTVPAVLPGCVPAPLAWLDGGDGGKFQTEEVLLFPSPRSAELHHKRKKKKVFFFSTAKKQELKLYDCYKYYMLRAQYLCISVFQGWVGSNPFPAVAGFWTRCISKTAHMSLFACWCILARDWMRTRQLRLFWRSQQFMGNCFLLCNPPGVSHMYLHLNSTSSSDAV